MSRRKYASMKVAASALNASVRPSWENDSPSATASTACIAAATSSTMPTTAAQPAKYGRRASATEEAARTSSAAMSNGSTNVALLKNRSATWTSVLDGSTAAVS